MKQVNLHGPSDVRLDEVPRPLPGPRDVVVRDTTRVRALPAGSPWIVRDLDTPQDLAAARAWLAEHGEG